MNENPATPTDSEQAAPPQTFDVLPLSEETRRAIDEMGYKNPTPVQVAVWDPATRGRDAVVQARTGTGKTASFGLPLIDQIVKRSLAAPQALVLCPTRELALQVCAELEKIGKYREVKLLPIYGGASMERQVSGIQGGAQVVVGTPGRVLDHIRRRTLPVASIKMLVLDEADEMLSMGFERELSAILEALPKERQTLLFSATVPPDIERISKNKLKSPEFLTLSGDHIGALEILHFTYSVNADKVGSLVRILEAENPESAVIFCNTKDETETVASALQKRGYDADWLNGDLPQSDREKVMTATKEGRLRFLVATDVAARGIDISHLTHVINYDFPLDAEAYVHRTGRTGRAGRTGTAISLVGPRDVGSLYYLRLTYKIRPIEREIPSTEELRTRAEADLIALLAQTLLSDGPSPEDRALARRLLGHDQAEQLVAGLLKAYVDKHPNAEIEAAMLRRQPPKKVALKPRPPRREAPPLRMPGPFAASRADASAAPQAAAGGSAATPMPIDAPGPSEDVPTAPRPAAGRDRPPRDRERQDRRPARADAPPPRGRPARDFRSWSPPEEDGDDQPLLVPGAAPADAAADRGRAADPERGRDRPRGDRDRGSDRDRPRGGPDRPRRARDEQSGPDALHAEPSVPGGDFRAVAAPDAPDLDGVPYVELFLGVGRRDGARAQDLLRSLVELAGLDKDHVRRIRVRDRHAFVAVRRDDAAKAIASLNGQGIAGKPAVNVELARERPADEVGAERPAES